MSQTKYPKSTPFLETKINGYNRPIVYSDYLELFEKTSIALIVASVLILLLLFAGIIAGKFIGL